MYPLRASARGISLWELLACIAISGVLAAFTLPGFGATSARSRIAASHNLLLSSLYYARSTAILQGIPSSVCLSADATRCLRSATAGATGWLVFIDAERHGSVQVDAADTVLRHIELPREVTVRGSRAAVTYWPVTLAGTTSTFLFCHAGYASVGRAIVVSQSGRPRTAADGAWTDSLRCAA